MQSLAVMLKSFRLILKAVLWGGSPAAKLPGE